MGKVFGPAERGEQVTVAAVAVLLDGFNYVGAVFGGREGVAQGVGYIQLVLCGDVGDDAVGLGQQLLHDGVGESTECEHDVGLSGRGAEGFLAQLHADECALAEVVEVGLVVVVEPVEGLNDFGGGESGVDAFLGGGGMGAAAFEAVDDACGGGGEGAEVEHHGAEGESGQVVVAVDALYVVLLQDAGVEYFLCPGAGLFLGLEDEDDGVASCGFLLPKPLCGLQQYGGMAVMAAAVAGGQCVDVAPDGDGGVG